MPSVAILALDHCLLSGVVGPLEILTIANGLAAVHASGNPARFAPLQVAGTPGQALGFCDRPLAVDTSLDTLEADIILLPPIFGPLEPLLENSLLVSRLRQLHASGTILASCCAGSFLLAETGLLDGHEATTHWQLVDRFRARYPKVDLQPQRMLIDGGHYICAGGAMAWQDLTLHLVARFQGRTTAAACAKTLVMDGARRVQTPYFMFDQGSTPLEQGHPGQEGSGVNKARQWMQRHYQQTLTLDELADRAGMGVRTFLRRFKEATGQTPVAYLQQLRVEAARHLLEVSDMGTEEITAQVGYADAASFRRLFKGKTGLTPGEYRSRFGHMN